MKKLVKVIIGIIISIILLLIILPIFRKPYKICCNNNCFNIEIADTTESRQLGLMYRENLGNNEGMLFIYDKPGPYSFWMKNTLIPLAGIRIDENMKIVDIIQMNPCKTEECPSYKPKYNAKYILEINQWLINEKGLLHNGDYCELFQQVEILNKIKGNWNILKSKIKS